MPTHALVLEALKFDWGTPIQVPIVIGFGPQVFAASASAITWDVAKMELLESDLFEFEDEIA